MTNQRTTRAEYGHPGLQSIVIQKSLRSKETFGYVRCSEAKAILSRRTGSRIQKGTIDLDYRSRQLVGMGVLLNVPPTGHSDL